MNENRLTEQMIEEAMKEEPMKEEPMKEEPMIEGYMIEEPMKVYTSATVVSTAANYIMNSKDTFTHTYRTYIQTRENGPLKLRFWHSNAVDSTWDQGEVARGSESGGAWVIEAAYVADGGKISDSVKAQDGGKISDSGKAQDGEKVPDSGKGPASEKTPDGSVVAGSQIPVTFGGSPAKVVEPGERFWSDSVEIDLPEGHYLAFTWTITTTNTGKTFPYNTEQMLVTAYDAPGNLADSAAPAAFALSDNLLVLPAFIGYEKPVDQQVVFFGDSITQGVRTLRDGYEYWVARIANGLGAQAGIWNIGSGWARAYDAAEDGAWLHKAKQGQQVMIALGVNDIDIGKRTAEQLLGDLATIVRLLKQNEPSTEIILFTVPPFNFSGEQEQIWRQVNETIRTVPPEGVSRVFDMAAVLSQPAPLEHRLRPEYMSSKDDPHPNGTAGKAVSDAFLAWYR